MYDSPQRGFINGTDSNPVMSFNRLVITHGKSSVPVLDRFSFSQVKSPREYLDSALLLDKPSGWTSYDMIRRLKRYFPRYTKIGHTGTLDPLATGLLILLFGKATKSQQIFLELPKVYDGTLRLGETTPSMDSETNPVEKKNVDGITLAHVQSACENYTGEIQQIPPMYSAVKVGGERLYKKARRGESVRRKPNTVTVYSFKVLQFDGAYVKFRVRCSKGTYIRVLAHDVGKHLGVGGHLTQLRRTAIGNYQVEHAPDITEVIAALENHDH